MGNTYTEGQRWISESEPELGLGTLVQIDGNKVSLLFPATGELRQYAGDNAPLKRVRFREGDEITDHEDRTIKIIRVEENANLLIYHGEEQSVPEAQLNDRISFSRPEDRLLNAHCDDLHAFYLRTRCSYHRFKRQQAPNRGFVGGRVDLIPHQLYIADEVSARHAPRVLLSDEVGLGKTIEACLILHRLLVSGRAERVLIVVPESLVHQWFVELLRKFNLWVNIFDEERCEAIEANQESVNPFLDDQLVLCSTGLIGNSTKRRQQAVEAGWDLLIVDEAHHLEWSEDDPSEEYQAIESVARKTEGLLLLTATPEQLGPESHFARLRLLDPERYQDFGNFQQQSDQYESVARIADALHQGTSLTTEEQTVLKDLLNRKAPVTKPEDRESALNELLDFHGPGRVIFRNTRAAISGFPKRVAQLATLKSSSNETERLDHAATEFAADAGDQTLQSFLSLDDDPRIKWLTGLLKELSDDKILLICHSKEKALAVDDALRNQITTKTAVFHEDLPLIQRDRNAAWFAEDEGAQLLICSEIGSEGRNFQFAHHIVLFDLPLNPELVEQRIGRLDRIGQKQDIQIHVPSLAQSPQEAVAQWYHHALDALETNLEGGHYLYQQFGQQIHDFALEYPAIPKSDSESELNKLLEDSKEARIALTDRLKKGRDKLLELSSFRRQPAQALIDQILKDDASLELETFMSEVFDHYGVHVEELAPRTYRLDASGVITDAFPAIPKEGVIATYDRQRALSREDVTFLTWDHPMVTGAMDLILSSELGNSCFAIWPDQTDPGLLLDAVFELNTIAPGQWHADRFLPRTPIRVTLDHQLEPFPSSDLPRFDSRTLKDSPPYRLLDNDHMKNELLPAMLESADSIAQQQARTIRETCLKEMSSALDGEITRLESLAKMNDHVRPAELELAKGQKEALHKAIKDATVRLDSVRVIWKTPESA